MEIFHAFGIDARLLLIQIINFGLLLFVLWKFLYTPLLNLLDERRAKVAQGVRDAEAAGKKLADAESSSIEVLRTANKEAEGALERARRDALTKEAEIVKEAEAKAARVLSAAEKEGDEMKANALLSAKEEMAKLIVLGAEKALLKK